MEAQMHSFWRLISLRHLFAEVFGGVLKQPKATLSRAAAAALLTHERAGGELLVQQECFPDIHSAPSLPYSHSRSCAGDRNDSCSDHSMHSLASWQSLSLKGSCSSCAPAALLAFSRWAQLFSPVAHLNKEVPWTLLNGLQTEAAAGR